jgi:hypothetical protein
MGGCACTNNITSYFKDYSVCVLKSENNINAPEQNIKIIPREDIDNIDKMENNENSKQNERNEKNNDKLTKNNNSNTHDENQILIDNNPNNNLYLQNIKQNEIENNKDNKNNSFSINNQINKNNNLNNNNLNNDNSNKNNLNNNNNINNDDIETNKLFQEKVAVKKAETNYNYNLGDHNVIFINISRDSSIIKNDSEKGKIESTTPKMAVEKENLDDMAIKGGKRIFSHFCKHRINEKSPKNKTTTNNLLVKRKHTINDYMNNYSDEMLNALNSIRKDPESFITFIDDMIKNSKRTNEGVFITSQIFEDKYMLTEEYLLVFEQIKSSLRDIIKSDLSSNLEDFKYNDELEIMLDDTKDYTMNQSHIEKSSSISNNNDKYNSGNNNNNHIIKRIKRAHKSLDLSDDKIANIILQKRKEIKSKYPYNIFKMNIIKDIKINILMQISMEEYYNNYNEKKMLKDIIFNPQYKNFAVSWANELNRKFISISCFA